MKRLQFHIIVSEQKKIAKNVMTTENNENV